MSIVPQPAPDLHPRIAAAIRTTLERGQTMAEQGYLYDPVDATGRVWFCRRPTPIVHADGTIVTGYRIDAHDDICECPMWERGGTCKHIEGLRRHIDAVLERITAPQTAWQVVEMCPVLGELVGLTYPTADAAWAAIRAEHEGARLAGEPVPFLSVREVTK